ncbi:MAG: hypothetical protein ACI3U2_07505 [Anaerovibrio sp.]
MIDGVTKGLRRRSNCRKAARLFYTARQLGKAAEFIWQHRLDADPDEIVGMRAATRWQAHEFRRQARSLLTFCDEARFTL